MDIGIEYQTASIKAMRNMKINRLRQLVLWGYITQQQANGQYRQYLRGVFPIGKIPEIGK
jgi:hypothetical protein